MVCNGIVYVIPDQSGIQAQTHPVTLLLLREGPGLISAGHVLPRVL